MEELVGARISFLTGQLCRHFFVRAVHMHVFIAIRVA